MKNIYQIKLLLTVISKQIMDVIHKLQKELIYIQFNINHLHFELIINGNKVCPYSYNGICRFIEE